MEQIACMHLKHLLLVTMAKKKIVYLCSLLLLPVRHAHCKSAHLQYTNCGH